MPTPYGSDLKYFDLDGLPARQKSPVSVPEVLRGVHWTPLYDTHRFHHEAHPVDVDTFLDLITESNKSQNR